jgi:type IV secretory pathway VirB10-like protein
MSSRTNIIALCVGVLLTVGGGIYAFMPGSGGDQTANAKVESAPQVAVKPESEQPQQPPSKPSQASDPTQAANAAAAAMPQQPQAPVQASKRLTREQLTPPPATEEEKLQKAAERESNF